MCRDVLFSDSARRDLYFLARGFFIFFFLCVRFSTRARANANVQGVGEGIFFREVYGGKTKVPWVRYVSGVVVVFGFFGEARRAVFVCLFALDAID